MIISTETNTVSTVIAHRLTEYLEQHEKTADVHILDETVARMKHAIMRNLMQPRDMRPGKESNTLYAGPCARKSRLIFAGAEREPLRARSVLKFLLGDLVELSVLAVARLAGCHIEDNNIDLSLTARDGTAIPVHPDGRYVAEDGTQYNVEIKSCDSKTFDQWLAQGGPDDTWGYETQASVEVAAWREYGYPINGTLFLAVSTGSRQGSIAEWYKPFDPALVEAWQDRREAALGHMVPEIPFAAQPETQFLRGKECAAEYFAHGEPTKRTNEKGAIYGWDVFTGRALVPLVCTYCPFMGKQCWAKAQMDMSGTKPIWVVPS